MKTNKSYKKRLKVTRNGKIVARRPGQNHFNAKESSSERLLKQRPSVDRIEMSNKSKSRFLSNI